jgi:hypothetical protein
MHSVRSRLFVSIVPCFIDGSDLQFSSVSVFLKRFSDLNFVLKHNGHFFFTCDFEYSFGTNLKVYSCIFLLSVK